VLIGVDMAYSFFPKTPTELTEGIKRFDAKVQSEILSMFYYLQSKTGMETPINIDLAKPRFVNVSRAIDGTIDLSTIRRESNLSLVKIKFGNGSSGNRGVNNRGNLFEPQFADALLKWWSGGAVSDAQMLNAIQDLDKTYNLRKNKKIKVDVVGGENTKRPLVFSPKIQLTNPKGSNFDVGQSVTDITVHTDGDPIFLSLKLGSTTTFFNVGIRTILTPEEIKNYSIKNVNGLKLLNMFNIDPKKFCQVFNQEYPKNEKTVFVQSSYDRTGIQNLLESGVGYGYHIIHKMSGKILSKKMDKRSMETASRPQKLTIYYGGKTGTGRRIDMELETPTYRMKLNIRDTQGKDGYPTRMMCDFTYK
jgi:hypothetical protein